MVPSGRTVQALTGKGGVRLYPIPWEGWGAPLNAAACCHTSCTWCCTCGTLQKLGTHVAYRAHHLHHHAEHRLQLSCPPPEAGPGRTRMTGTERQAWGGQEVDEGGLYRARRAV